MSEDDGFVTVAVVGLASVLLGVSTLIATLGAVSVARHRAASAADLAALAAASHVIDGTACTAAARVAGLQRAQLESCILDGDRVKVQVAVRLGPLGQARARAEAGPVATGNG